MIPFLLFLAVAPVIQLSPAAPTVGDHITLVFPQEMGTITIDSNESYEVLSLEKNKAVVRSFRPGELVIEGRTALPGKPPVPHRFKVEIRSVLQPNDPMKPAPLKPPVELPENPIIRRSLMTAAISAAAVWLLLAIAHVRRAKQQAPEKEIILGPREELAAAIERLRKEKQDLQYVLLAEATRRFLSRVEPRLGRELTSAELLRQARGTLTDEEHEALDRILLEADWVKFSPWPRQPEPIGPLVARVLRTADRLTQPAAEVAA